MTYWNQCRNILVIRADNMGDLIMSSPAIRAVKESFQCRITLLSSYAAAQAAELIPQIDEVITADLPWIKKDKVMTPDRLISLAEKLKSRRFDGCIIFTVYSQSALPAAMLAWMSGIRLRLAYCRENPYELLTNWIPDKEPYTWIRHQVKRDIALVESIGAVCCPDSIQLKCRNEHIDRMKRKMMYRGLNPSAPFILFHPGVTEVKRLFPEEIWIELIQETSTRFGIPLLLTGSAQDIPITEKIRNKAGRKAVSVAGLFNIPEFAALIKHASLMVSVNTGSVHLAAGLQTPVIVLYARTNPQHTPWKTPSKVLEYSVPEVLQSRNEVIRYVNELVYDDEVEYPTKDDIVRAMKSLLGEFTPGERTFPDQSKQRSFRL